MEDASKEEENDGINVEDEHKHCYKLELERKENIEVKKEDKKIKGKNLPKKGEVLEDIENEKNKREQYEDVCECEELYEKESVREEQIDFQDAREKHSRDILNRFAQKKRIIRLLKRRVQAKIIKGKEKINKSASKIWQEIKAKKGISTLRKICYITLFLLVIMSSISLGKNPELYYIWHTIQYVILIIIRFILFKWNRWHYYMFDFCYYANLLLLIYLWIYSHNVYMWKIIFGFNGILGISIFLFQDSLVPHSLQRVTSAINHLSPLIVMYTIFWFSSPSFSPPPSSSCSFSSSFSPSCSSFSPSSSFFFVIDDPNYIKTHSTAFSSKHFDNNICTDKTNGICNFPLSGSASSYSETFSSFSLCYLGEKNQKEEEENDNHKYYTCKTISSRSLIYSDEDLSCFSSKSEDKAINKNNDKNDFLLKSRIIATSNSKNYSSRNYYNYCESYENSYFFPYLKFLLSFIICPIYKNHIINRKEFKTEKCDSFFSCFFSSSFICPLIAYFIWFVLYYLKLFILSPSKIEKKNYKTLYKYMAFDKGFLFKLPHSMQKYGVYFFMGGHFFLFIFGFLVIPLMYSSFYLHTAFILLCLTSQIYNGANFYIDFLHKAEKN